MDEDKKELLDTFQKMDHENRVNLLAYIRVAYSAQENTKKQYQKALKALEAGDLTYIIPDAGPVMGATNG